MIGLKTMKTPFAKVHDVVALKIQWKYLRLTSQEWGVCARLQFRDWG